MSNDIVAEMEKMLVLSARRQILRSINGKQFFAIIADESADISKTEQISISFRTASETYDVKEEFIGIMPCKEGLTADALLSYITDIFIRCGVNNDKFIAMSFDGASAMKLLAEKLKNCYGQQVSYIHCLAHCTELVVKDTISSSELLQLAMCTLKKLYTFLGVYPKRVKLFEQMQEVNPFADRNEDISSLSHKTATVRIKNLSQTRWTARADAAKVVIDKQQPLIKTLEAIKVDSSLSWEVKADARGLIRMLSSFPTLLSLVCTFHLLAVLEKLCKELQTVKFAANHVIYAFEKTKHRIKEMRCEEEFKLLMDKTKHFKLPSEDEIPSKRQRRVPLQAEDYVGEYYACSSLPDYDERDFRKEYYVILDQALSSLDKRFDQSDLNKIGTLEKLLIDGANNKKIDDTLRQRLELELSDFIDCQALVEEVKDLPFAQKVFNANSAVPIKKVTSLDTICDVMNHNASTKKLCPTIHVAVQYYCCVPLTSATAERSFSTMRRVKNYLRSTSGSDHLNNAMFASIHPKLMDQMDLKAITNEFVKVNDSRLHYFGLS